MVAYPIIHGFCFASWTRLSLSQVIGRVCPFGSFSSNDVHRKIDTIALKSDTHILPFQVAEYDPLYPDAIALAKRLAADDVDCELMVVKDASHAFDRLCDPDTPQWRAREEANQMIERRIRAAYTQEDV